MAYLINILFIIHSFSLHPRTNVVSPCKSWITKRQCRCAIKLSCRIAGVFDLFASTLMSLTWLVAYEKQFFFWA